KSSVSPMRLPFRPFFGPPHSRWRWDDAPLPRMPAPTKLVTPIPDAQRAELRACLRLFHKVQKLLLPIQPGGLCQILFHLMLRLVHPQPISGISCCPEKVGGGESQGSSV